ncbi:transposase [Pseudomonas sp. JDS28PS106]|uniref:REP-associated tyrosine transposase n=1 Tax=Pseudomonas sp. JDS28PS106 TaxID=2497235 RepID=UPI002FD72FDE
MSSHSHSRALRRGRYSCAHHIYLVTTSTFDRTPVFTSLALGRLLVDELRLAQEQDLAHSLAWVVMPDHLHWLFELRAESLSGLIQRVKSKSAAAVNRARGASGQLWQDGFHDRAIRDERDLVNFARYIVANPVRAGLVPSIREYSLWDAIWI